MNTPTQEQIDRLPKWAREHIETIERQRDNAKKALSEMLDDQTPNEFRYDDYVNGDFVTRYVQTYKMTVVHEGVRLDIVLPKGSQGRQGIEITWASEDRGMRELCFVPTSFQQASIFLPENAR